MAGEGQLIACHAERNAIRGVRTGRCPDRWIPPTQARPDWRATRCRVDAAGAGRRDLSGHPPPRPAPAGRVHPAGGRCFSGTSATCAQRAQPAHPGPRNTRSHMRAGNPYPTNTVAWTCPTHHPASHLVVDRRSGPRLHHPARRRRSHGVPCHRSGHDAVRRILGPTQDLRVRKHRVRGARAYPDLPVGRRQVQGHLC